MAIKSQIKTLRAHKVAALVVDARLYARRTPEEACALLGWDTRHLQALESAAITPSLPELEALAAIYAVPVDHFFGTVSLSDEMPKLRVETMQQRLELRNRILGAMIMQARSRRNLSRDDLSMVTNLSIEQITQYELGQVPLPVTDLEDIMKILQINILDWIDSYAIPTRDMVFRPLKVAELQPQQQIKEPESRQELPHQSIQPEPPATTLTQEDVELEPIQDQIQQTQVPEPSLVEQEPRQYSPRQVEEIDLDAEKHLSNDLIEFISNPVNKQYLILASNLSHMPADQLRRIAESLLEITF